MVETFTVSTFGQIEQQFGDSFDFGESRDAHVGGLTIITVPARAEEVASGKSVVLVGLIASDLHPPHGRDRARLIRNVRSRVRRIAERSFGQRRLRIQTVAFQGGSIDLWLVVSTVMVTAYLFFKDYEDVRKGFNLFSADLRANGRRLRRYFERFGRHKP